MSTDARGAVVRDEDRLPEGIGADIAEGQGEGRERRVVGRCTEGWVRGTANGSG